jgi:hypothetical protein
MEIDAIEQDSNALSPISKSRTGESNVIRNRPRHLAKDQGETVSTEDGMQIDESDSQS